jgi:O-antigen ligase
MALPVLFAITFEEYSEERWGVRTGDDLTTVFNARLVDALPISVFDLSVVVAIVTSAAMFPGSRVIDQFIPGTPLLVRLLALASVSTLYGGLIGVAHLLRSDDYESFHVLRELRPLVLALIVVIVVSVIHARDRWLLRPLVGAMVAGIIARAAIGTIRHIGGGGRWYQGDRMVYFDGTDSVLFLGAAAVLALVVIRSPRPRTAMLAFLGVAPLVYAFVFSYRRSVWLGAVVAVAAVVVLERRAIRARRRIVAGSIVVGIALVGVGLAWSSPTFLTTRIASIADLHDESSNTFRIHDLRNGLHDVAAHYGVGAGFGGRAEVVSSVPEQAAFIQHVARTNHNSAVYLTMKMGVLGAAAWGALLLATTLRAIRRRHHPARETRDEARILVPTLIAAGVASMFFPFVYNVRPMVLWGVVAGIVWAEGPRVRASTSHQIDPARDELIASPASG